MHPFVTDILVLAYVVSILANIKFWIEVKPLMSQSHHSWFLLCIHLCKEDAAKIFSIDRQKTQKSRKYGTKKQNFGHFPQRKYLVIAD